MEKVNFIYFGFSFQSFFFPTRCHKTVYKCSLKCAVLCLNIFKSRIIITFLLIVSKY